MNRISKFYSIIFLCLTTITSHVIKSSNEFHLIRYFYGHTAWNEHERICTEYPMTEEQFITLRTNKEMDDSHPADIELFKKIKSLINSPDEKMQFMGLYFAAQLIQEMPSKPLILDHILKEFLQDIIHTYSNVVIIQILWILSLYPGNNEWLINHTYRYLVQCGHHYNAAIRTSVLDLAISLLDSGKLNDVSFICNYDESPLVLLAQQIIYHQRYHDELNLNYVTTTISEILKSDQELERFTVLRYLLRLCNDPEYHNFIEQTLLNTIANDTPFIQMQALYVASKCSFIPNQTSIPWKELAQQNLHNPDWHIRFGSILLLEKLLRADEAFDELHVIRDQCKQDENICIQLLAEM